jgi:protein-S-isoprenylcysteine O-methyltransferase
MDIGFWRKALQAIVVWAIVLMVLYFRWPPALGFLQLWLLVGISIVANVSQPAYRLFEGSRTPQDRGTAAQILWTVYLTQALALFELVIKRPTGLPVDFVSWAAFLVMVAGLALRGWAVFILRGFFTWNIELQPGQSIIQTGPYRFIRHPGYTGAFMIFAASCFLLHSWAAGVVASISLALAFQRRIRLEESLLRENFPEYTAYAARIGALVPRILRPKLNWCREAPSELRCGNQSLKQQSYQQ